ncbi:MAG: glycoside hydrolase family 16 protein [Lachnospiraceae bacterium]|nr:glycoside hydrolase family 16 protein [Lachnospiraceae bacterium]
MKKITNTLAIAGTATLVFAATVFATPAQDVKAAYGRYELVWSDEFSGTELDKNSWEPLIGNGKRHNNPGWGNQEFEYYTDHEGEDGNILVSNGTLKIIAKQEAVHDDFEGDFDYTSARLVSSGKQSFKYGKIEAKIKLPKTVGTWPAFWMMGYNDQGWPYCGEIDILEAWNDYQFAQGAWHYNASWSSNWGGHEYDYRQCTKYSPLLDFDGTRVTDANGVTVKAWQNFDKTQWHTYGVIWDEDAIRFTVDDKIYWREKITDEMTEAKGEFYFLLNLAVGGTLPGYTVDNSGLPTQMEVDYVRVYQRKGEKGVSSYTSNGWRNKAPQYKVTVKDGTKSYFNGNVYDLETVIIPTSLKKKGYMFEGFYNQDGKKITSDTRINKAMTITAKWTKVKAVKPTVKLTGKKKAMTVSLKADKAKGYQFKYGKKKNMSGSKTVNTTKKSYTVKKLKKGTTYYVKARSYKLDSKKEKVWSSWSKVVKVKVK